MVEEVEEEEEVEPPLEEEDAALELLSLSDTRSTRVRDAKETSSKLKVPAGVELRVER